MKNLNVIYSFILSVVLAVFMSDFILYAVLFPDKKIIVVVMFSCVCVFLVIVGKTLLDWTYKTLIVNLVIVFILSSFGFYNRISGINEFTARTHSAQSVFKLLKPKLTTFVEINKVCPNSYEDIKDLDGVSFRDLFAYESFKFIQVKDTCYLISNFFNNLNLKIGSLNDKNHYYFITSEHWNFLMNKLIYWVSSYEEEMFNFGVGVKLAKQGGILKVNNQKKGNGIP